MNYNFLRFLYSLYIVLYILIYIQRDYIKHINTLHLIFILHVLLLIVQFLVGIFQYESKDLLYKHNWSHWKEQES